jgi:hypothetical protein
MIPLFLILTLCLLGILFVNVVSRIAQNIKDIQNQNKLQCTRHRWTLREEDETMVCGNCGIKAGE